MAALIPPDITTVNSAVILPLDRSVPPRTPGETTRILKRLSSSEKTTNYDKKSPLANSEFGNYRKF